MELQKLYLNRSLLDKYPEQTFVQIKEDIGIVRPIAFISNKKMVSRANHFSLDQIEEQNYNINIVTSDSFVLMYIINVKTPIYRVYSNGIIVRNRVRWDNERDMEGISTRYTFEEFIVITNKNQTTAIFCKSLASEQKT